MALIIEPTSLSDPPTFNEFTLGANLLGGYLQITGNPAEVELLYGRYGAQEKVPPQILPLGSYRVDRSPSGTPLAGLRARNATAGLGAVLGGYFWTESDPTISFIGLASSQAVGAVVIPVVELADWPPTAPVDGQTVWLELPAGTYNPVGGDPVRWLCTFDASGNVWQVSGAPLYNVVEASEGRQNAAYGDLATVGPSLTVPVAGDYLVACGARLVSQAGNSSSFMSYAVGAVAASDNDAARFGYSGMAGAQAVFASSSNRRFKTGVSALDVITAKYRNDAVVVSTWQGRWLEVSPVAIANA